jgi:hypothetical protein
VRSSSFCRQADGGSECLGYRVAGEEAGESVGDGGGVLRVQEVGEAGQVEWLGVGQPSQQQLVPFGEYRGAGRSQDCERWLLDAAGVVFGERPLPGGGYFLGEERVGVGDCLLEGAGQPVVERGAVAGSEDAAEEDVDRCGLVARVVALEGGQATSVPNCRSASVGGAGRAASMRVRVCTASGASRASWSAIGALEEWPMMWALVMPSWRIS